MMASLGGWRSISRGAKFRDQLIDENHFITALQHSKRNSSLVSYLVLFSEARPLNRLFGQCTQLLSGRGLKSKVVRRAQIHPARA
jgi:hypothetical protein